jgi:hypothetical protein
MNYTNLPHTDIEVSKICLGTMTWGNQNTEEEGHEQMDYAVDQGINFFDTAELYPIPAHADRYAETEKIIGKWFQKNGNRDKIILASPVRPKCQNLSGLPVLRPNPYVTLLRAVLNVYRPIISTCTNCIGPNAIRIISEKGDTNTMYRTIGKTISTRFYRAYAT